MERPPLRYLKPTPGKTFRTLNEAEIEATLVVRDIAKPKPAQKTDAKPEAPQPQKPGPKSFGLFLHENQHFENYFLYQERDLVILRSMMVG